MATKAPAPSKTPAPAGGNKGSTPPSKAPAGAPSKSPAPAGGKKK